MHEVSQDRAETRTSPGTKLEHPHPRSGEYVRIAIILAILTSIEVLVYYTPTLRPVIVEVLIILSACKFALVVMFFMHLRFDNRLFSAFFTGPLILAFGVLVALGAIFQRIIFGG